MLIPYEIGGWSQRVPPDLIMEVMMVVII